MGEAEKKKQTGNSFNVLIYLNVYRGYLDSFLAIHYSKLG